MISDYFNVLNLSSGSRSGNSLTDSAAAVSPLPGNGICKARTLNCIFPDVNYRFTGWPQGERAMGSSHGLIWCLVLNQCAFTEAVSTALLPCLCQQILNPCPKPDCLLEHHTALFSCLLNTGSPDSMCPGLSLSPCPPLCFPPVPSVPVNGTTLAQLFTTKTRNYLQFFLCPHFQHSRSGQAYRFLSQI